MSMCYMYAGSWTVNKSSADRLKISRDDLLISFGLCWIFGIVVFLNDHKCRWCWRWWNSYECNRVWCIYFDRKAKKKQRKTTYSPNGKIERNLLFSVMKMMYSVSYGFSGIFQNKFRFPCDFVVVVVFSCWLVPSYILYLLLMCNLFR